MKTKFMQNMFIMNLFISFYIFFNFILSKVNKIYKPLKKHSYSVVFSNVDDESKERNYGLLIFHLMFSFPFLINFIWTKKIPKIQNAEKNGWKGFFFGNFFLG